MLTIDKQRAAKSEIETAIRTFFGSHDLVSSYVLACAGAEIAASVAKHRGRETMAASLARHIVGSQVGTVQRLVNDPYNFLKHADRDPEGEMQNFDPRSVEFKLFFAEEDYAIAFGERTPVMMAFRVWFDCRYPEFLINPSPKLAQASQLLESPAGKPAQETLPAMRRLIALLDENPSEFGTLTGSWQIS